MLQEESVQKRQSEPIAEEIYDDGMLSETVVDISICGISCQAAAAPVRRIHKIYH